MRLALWLLTLVFSFQAFAMEMTWDFLSPFKKPLWSLGAKTNQETETNTPKTVLYLGGESPYAAWYYLGAFYAFESYGVKIDSVVGNSLGAWVAGLWKSGYSLDDIQRLLRDPHVAKMLSEKNAAKDSFKYFKLPIAQESKASALQMRLAFTVDSNKISVNTLPLEADSSHLAEMAFRLRVEESLFRKPLSKKVTSIDCEGHKHEGALGVIKTMPFQENVYGVGCLIPLPSGSEENEFSVILSALPKRYVEQKNTEEFRNFFYQDRELSFVKNSFLVIRPHLPKKKSPESWMQSGFSEVEKKLGEFSAVQKLSPYETKSEFLQPWFRLIPVVDSIPSELHGHLLSYWNEQDSGLAAIDSFAKRLVESPVYDSVSMEMRGNGTIQIKAKSPLVIDLQGGGFGSSAFGPFIYGDFRVRYVSQFEYELGTNIFYGMGGFGVSPEFRLLRLLEGKLDFGIRYDYSHLKPLQSFLNHMGPRVRIEEEWRNDVTFQLDYHLDLYRSFSVKALIGKREYQLDKRLFQERLSVRPIAPEISFEQNPSKENPWFAKNGVFVKTTLGLESVGAVFGEGETVPIFWKLKGNASLAHSPVSFFSLGLHAFAGANIYQEEGETYPPSFGFEPIDNTIRQEILATPYGNSWYLNEYRSHHYVSAGARLGLHLGLFSAWIFGSYVHDFEENPMNDLDKSRIALEPLLRFAYKSIEVSVGMTRMVDLDSVKDLTELSDYRYFIQVGRFAF